MFYIQVELKDAQKTPCFLDTLVNLNNVQVSATEALITICGSDTNVPVAQLKLKIVIVHSYKRDALCN
jgi:hypothetical protein